MEWRFGPIGFPADCRPRLDMGSGYGIDNIALPHHRARDGGATSPADTADSIGGALLIGLIAAINALRIDCA